MYFALPVLTTFSSAGNKLTKLRPKLGIDVYESSDFQDAGLNFQGSLPVEFGLGHEVVVDTMQMI